MSQPEGREATVAIEVIVPVSLREWLDRRAGALYKSRSAYTRDLLVDLYRRDQAKAQTAA